MVGRPDRVELDPVGVPYDRIVPSVDASVPAVWFGRACDGIGGCWVRRPRSIQRLGAGDGAVAEHDLPSGLSAPELLAEPSGGAWMMMWDRVAHVDPDGAAAAPLVLEGADRRMTPVVDPERRRIWYVTGYPDNVLRAVSSPDGTVAAEIDLRELGVGWSRWLALDRASGTLWVVSYEGVWKLDGRGRVVRTLDPL